MIKRFARHLLEDELQDRYDTGYQIGKSTGYEVGFGVSRHRKDLSYAEGWNHGQKSADITLWNEGYDAGKKEGYDTGYQTGNVSDRLTSYLEGWSVGFEAAKNLLGEASQQDAQNHADALDQSYLKGYDAARSENDKVDAELDSQRFDDFDQNYADGYGAGKDDGFQKGITHAGEIVLASVGKEAFQDIVELMERYVYTQQTREEFEAGLE